jgi:hypothetical protein
MLQRQEELRFSEQVIQRMHCCTFAGGQWLDVVHDLQREVAYEFGFRSSSGISSAVHAMRTAHVSKPDLAKLSVYSRINIAEMGSLGIGCKWPDVPLINLDSAPCYLRDYCKSLTVLCAGSWT